MLEKETINILRIVPGTSVDGPGLRTSIYLSGCSHNCPDCHNPESHSPHGGEEMTIERIISEINENGFDVTLTGGDPLFNPKNVIKLVRAIKEEGYNIWLYTGYTFEEIFREEELTKVLHYVDVLVDGPYIKELRDLSLHFRGSSNQRLIDVQQSLRANRLIYWKSSF